MTKNQKLWTKEEDLFLKEQYGRMTLQKIGECLNRSKESVNKRVSRLQLRNKQNGIRKKWTPDQDTFLKVNINRMNNREIGKHLGKSPSSVANRIRLLKLVRNASLRRWTKKEDEYLLKWYGVKSLDQISRRLQRSIQALESRLYRLGIRGVRAHLGIVTVYELAECLQVDVHSIYNWIQKKELPYNILRAKLVAKSVAAEKLWKMRKDEEQDILVASSGRAIKLDLWETFCS